MVTAGLNLLALARIEAIRLVHGERDPGLLVIGLGAIVAAIAAVAQRGRREAVKN